MFISPFLTVGNLVLKKKTKLLFVCVCLSIYVYMCAGARGGQKNASDPLELELTVDCELCPLKEQQSI